MKPISTIQTQISPKALHQEQSVVVPWTGGSVTLSCTASRHLCKRKRIARIQMGTDVLNPAGICGLKPGQNLDIELRTFPALRISYLPSPQLLQQCTLKCLPSCLYSTLLSACEPSGIQAISLHSTPASLRQIFQGTPAVNPLI